MIVEVSLSCKRFGAGGVCAVVRFLARVQSQMSLQVSFLEESFAAVFEGAHVVSDAVVLLDVHRKTLRAGVALAAAMDWTHKLLPVFMDF